MNHKIAELGSPSDGLFLPSSRVDDRFPVTLVYPRHVFGRRVIPAWAKSYDQKGLCVTTDASLPRGRKVTVRFNAPESLPDLTGVACDFPGQVVPVRESEHRSAPGCQVHVQWERPLPELVAARTSARRWRLGFLLLAMLAAMAWLRWTSLAYFWYDPVFYFYSIAIAVFFVSRFYYSYVFHPPVFTGATPSLSIVISVRNEEVEIVKTVESCYAADYPDDQREVIVVNDGSTDRTWEVLQELKRGRFPELRAFDIPPSGKRHGMARGIREARGELLVFVDSDTFVERMALRHIVSGFEDPSLGAVSGLTVVGNAGKNMVTSMQEIKYSLSYDLLKTPESHFSCVTCCPGCLSAYRRKYVLEILEPWLNQTFMGAPATFGDDRSLTNYILRKYRVEYNPLAVCATIVPETWGRLITQQTRWKKSWLRETLIAGRFMWKKNPVAALSFYLAALCSVVSPFMGLRAVWLGATYDGAVLQGYVTGLFLLGLTLGLFVLWRRPRRNWYQVWVMIASQVLFMGPLTYYAFATMRKNHWGTR